jgi:hypothetical protein
VPAAFFEAGQVVEVPEQVWAGSHSPAEMWQTVPAFPAGCWQAALLPSHWSLVQGLPSSVHVVPAGVFTSLGQAVDVPVQVSAGSHSPAEAWQTVPALPAGCWQVTLLPSHWSLVQGLPSSVQAVPLPFLASVGQVVEVPVQVSAVSHSPAEARQVVPALPAGCWQAALEPSHWSLVQGLPSSVQAVPLGFFTSVGQAVDIPVHISAGSHSPADA